MRPEPVEPYSYENYIAVTPETIDFLAMHLAWLEKNFGQAKYDHRRKKFLVEVSTPFYNLINRIAVREKLNNISNATYIAVTLVLFAPEGTDIESL